MSAVYTRSAIKSRFIQLVSGTITSADQNTLLNRATLDVWADLDIRSSKRKTALSPNLFDDTYQYTCPSDLKGLKIVDIKPQTDRGRFDDWRFTTSEEFDRFKQDQRVDSADEPFKENRGNWTGENLVAISDYDFVRKLLISKPVDDDEIVISTFDSKTGWTAVGDAENIANDASNFIRESGAVSWDIGTTGGTTAGLYKSDLTAFDITDYKSEGSILVWVYIVSTTNLTNFILKIGSDVSNYYSITITTNSEGTSFYAGWNLLRFSMASKSTTLTPDDENMDYVSLYMTKAAGKISEVGYRFDHLVIKLGKHYDIVYYSKYGWQNSSGTYLENSTDDTDYLNVDSDELRLVEMKYGEYAERLLRNPQQAEFNRQLYEKTKQQYQFDNPSEAKIITTTYQTISLDNQ